MALNKFNDWVMKQRMTLGYSINLMAEKLGTLSQDLRAFEMGDEFYLYDIEGAIIPSIEIVNRIQKLFDERGMLMFQHKSVKGLSFCINASNLDDFKKQWGELVKYTRSLIGISQKEFANLIGVSTLSIRNWEKNKIGYAPRSTSIFKIASLYGPMQLILNGGTENV